MTGSFGKRMLWLIAIAAVASAATQILSCSSPLTTEDVTGQTDTVVLIIQVADTVLLIDTLYTPADTIFVPGDTLFLPADTVYIPGDTVFVPLDTIYAPGDTIFVPGDTIYVPGDTLYIPGDTIYVPGDTIYVPLDTVIVRDTVLQYCGRLEAPIQEIQWPLMNEPARYVLEFQAVLERDTPDQALNLDIGGRLFIWSLADTLAYRFEGDLSANTIVRITNIPPPARGHAIDICMLVRRI